MHTMCPMRISPHAPAFCYAGGQDDLPRSKQSKGWREWADKVLDSESSMIAITAFRLPAVYVTQLCSYMKYAVK